MKTLDNDYLEMYRRCETYHKLIDRLRDHAYGYETSLDQVLPYRTQFAMEPKYHRFGVERFLNELVRYSENLSTEANDCFTNDVTDKDHDYMKAMALCILYYLHTECRSADYTFLSFLKIAKSFLGSIEDPAKVNNLNASVFWIMYTDLSEEKRKSHPAYVQDAFTMLFDNFDYNYSSKMSNRLQHTIRFFLYDHQLDYLSNRMMSMALNDLVNEIIGRLKAVHENLMPRIGWRSYGNKQ